MLLPARLPGARVPGAVRRGHVRRGLPRHVQLRARARVPSRHGGLPPLRGGWKYTDIIIYNIYSGRPLRRGVPRVLQLRH